MKRLILAVLLAAGVAAPVRAQDVVSSNNLYPIGGTYTYAPATGSCPPDTVTFSGMAHALTQVTFGTPGVIETHVNLLGVPAVASTTGLGYHAVGHGMLASNSPPMQNFTAGTYEVIPDAPCPHTSITVVGTVNFDSTGHQDPATTSFQLITP